jgi:hypothetical protein
MGSPLAEPSCSCPHYAVQPSLREDTAFLSSAQTVRLAALASYLDCAPRGTQVRCEHVSRDAIPSAIESFVLLQPQPERLLFSALVNPLGIDERGHVFPFAYACLTVTPSATSMHPTSASSTEAQHSSYFLIWSDQPRRWPNNQPVRHSSTGTACS